MGKEAMKELRQVALIAAGVLAAGCASYGGTGSSQGSMISVEYGVVQQIERTELNASTGKGAALGGLIGLAVAAGTGGSTGQQVAGTAAGALVGGLIQHERKANNTAEQYTVLLNSGRTVAIVTEHHDIRRGDCVSVEQGKHANLRVVSPVMCSSMADTSHPAYLSTHKENVDEAAECEQAKQEVLSAKSEQEVSVAHQKMRALCEA
jgi:outer membrane lipoprotein SlyB